MPIAVRQGTQRLLERFRKGRLGGAVGHHRRRDAEERDVTLADEVNAAVRALLGRQAGQRERERIAGLGVRHRRLLEDEVFFDALVVERVTQVDAGERVGKGCLVGGQTEAAGLGADRQQA